jgi:hypothetical protein
MRQQSDTCSPERIHHEEVLPDRVWLTFFLGATLALAVAAVYSAWAYAYRQDEFLRFEISSPPPPALTQLFLKGTEGFITLLVPWLLYAIGVIIRGKINPRELIAFASTLGITLLTGAILFAIGMHFPWVPYPINWGSRGGRTMDMERLVQTFQAADRGDAEAYYRLHEHYLMTRQQNLAEYYLERAAELGHAESKTNIENRERVKRRQSTQAIDQRKRSGESP